MQPLMIALCVQGRVIHHIKQLLKHLSKKKSIGRISTTIISKEIICTFLRDCVLRWWSSLPKDFQNNKYDSVISKSVSNLQNSR